MEEINNIQYEDGIEEGVAPKAKGLLKRLIGDWPMFEQPPLEHSELKRLFSTRPSFVDYFSFVDFHDEQQVFILEDRLSCGAVFSIIPNDMEARSKEAVETFCGQLDIALRSLPVDSHNDDYPYVIQIYVEDREPKNVAYDLAKAANDDAKNSAYTEEWLSIMKEHFQMMSNPGGIYIDDRTDGSKGWRAIDRQITLVIYRKATKAIWAEDKYLSSFEQFNRSIEPFIQQLSTIGNRVTRCAENYLYQWLTPWFNPNPLGNPYSSVVDWLEHHPLKTSPEEKGAAYDLAQIICPSPPQKVDEYHAERGIMKFGEQYSRYLSLQGISQKPEAGCIATDNITEKSVRASVWDFMPPQSIMVWTIIPLSSHIVDAQLDRLAEKTRSASLHAQMAGDQLQQAKFSLLTKEQAIYYFQSGIYLRADNIEELDRRYNKATSLLSGLEVMNPIQERYDLFPTDSYIHNMPFSYDWTHDRKNALRSMKAYSAHIAAVSPLFGRARGSNNACFINYNRSGEIIKINPYHKQDKSRVAHSGLFGPTGAGKSATQVSQAMQSMAVNRPRQFFIDKGGSFSLLADFYERFGLKVRKINFQTSTDVCLPPFAETEMALKQVRGELIYDDDTAEDEKRDYLAEMLNAAILMITGGREKDRAELNNQDMFFIQKALINALEKSETTQQKHARPEDLMNCLTALADEERSKDEVLARKIQMYAHSLSFWTQGTRGHFFNRYGEGFSDDHDVVILELGVLTADSNGDMLAVAMSALISAITQMGEKHQYSGRGIEVYMDECHYVTANPLLVDSVVVGVKVWRKISIWLNLATQNITDFPDHAQKILSLIEFWWLLTMKEDEALKTKALLGLSEEKFSLITQCKKNTPYYVEGVMLSDKFNPMLLRFVPPAVCLALGMTDGDEKQAIQELCDQRGLSKLDAALTIAQEIIEKRQTFMPK